MKKIIGIDPGVSGAIAILSDNGEELHDMPTVQDGKKRKVNANELARILREHHDTYIVIIEKVHAMPGQGVVSMFNFGHSAGVIAGAIGALGFRSAYVTPQKWKKHHNLIGKDKDEARTRAIQRFPDAASMMARKKDCGRADALLMAEYGAQTDNI